MLGAIVTDRPTVELNGDVYTPADCEVSVDKQSPERVVYTLTFPQLKLKVNIAFVLHGSELGMKITSIEEQKAGDGYVAIQ